MFTFADLEMTYSTTNQKPIVSCNQTSYKHMGALNNSKESKLVGGKNGY